MQSIELWAITMVSFERVCPIGFGPLFSDGLYPSAGQYQHCGIATVYWRNFSGSSSFLFKIRLVPLGTSVA
jgi:hypothetical protein